MTELVFSTTPSDVALTFPSVGILILPLASGLHLFDASGFLCSTSSGYTLARLLNEEMKAPGAARSLITATAPPSAPTADPSLAESIRNRVAAMRNPADARPDGDDVTEARNIATQGLD